MHDAPIPQRYEAKYHLSLHQAQRIQSALSPWCTLDPMCTNGPYLLSSLYLDGPRFPLYHRTRQQHARRFKLRVRRYENNHLFAEVKSRIKSMVFKTRVPIQFEDWPSIWTHPSLDYERKMLHSQDQHTQWASFMNLALKTQAQPAVVIRYHRLAWVSQVDDYARVTFDTHLASTHALDGQIPLWDHEAQKYGGWTAFDVGSRFSHGSSGVVLELKTKKEIPLWMRELIVRFNLRWQGFSKYCSGLESVHPWRFNQLKRTLDQGLAYSSPFEDD